jgi:hypothetical protein
MNMFFFFFLLFFFSFFFFFFLRIHTNTILDYVIVCLKCINTCESRNACMKKKFEVIKEIERD